MVVADIDTGVRFDHPDLLTVAAGGKLLPGYDMIANASVGNDGDGRDADASDPGDWITAAEANNHFGFFYGCTPLDPGTGKPFEYSRDGATATLASRIPGEPLETTGLRYRVTVRK